MRDYGGVNGTACNNNGEDNGEVIVVILTIKKGRC